MELSTYGVHLLQPHVDFGLKLLGADLMAIPGLYVFVQVFSTLIELLISSNSEDNVSFHPNYFSGIH